MAWDRNIAKLLSHIQACHTAALPGRRLAFFIGSHHAGYVLPAFAHTLAAATAAFTLTPHAITLAPEAADELEAIAAAAGLIPRAEKFDVRETPDGPVLTTLDRGFLPDFGVIGVGVHLNGLVHRPDGLHLWVARRAANKKLDPGKLDNLVAGGVPAGLTPSQTLIKEAAEEAGLPETLAAQATKVAQLAYNMERPEGLRRDIVIAYDLILPESFIPSPTDGEVESFELWPLEKVLREAATDQQFKFNVNLVLIDLFLRHNLITGPGAITLRAALTHGQPATT